MDWKDTLVQMFAVLIVGGGLTWLVLCFVWWEFFVPEPSWVWLRGAVATAVLAVLGLKIAEDFSR